MKRLIIVRHGNTFLPDQIPTRIGCRTDLPLIETELAQRAGNYLVKAGINITELYAAPLKRTLQTAAEIKKAIQFSGEIIALPQFTEIDYGPDENKSEHEVKLRLGKQALVNSGIIAPTTAQALAAGETIIQNWNRHSQPPADWHFDTNVLISTWQEFVTAIGDGETVLLVSSNGIIRFAPHILSRLDYQNFINSQPIKVSTGAVSIFDYNGIKWTNKIWNKRP